MLLQRMRLFIAANPIFTPGSLSMLAARSAIASESKIGFRVANRADSALSSQSGTSTL